MDVPSDHIPYLKKVFNRLEIGLAGFLQASAPDWIIYDFAPHWLPPIATKLGMDDDDKDRVNPAITESSWTFGVATMDVPSDHIPYLKKAFNGLETGLAGFLQASAPDWIIYDFAPHWLPPIATKLGMDDDDKDRVNPAITESSWTFGVNSDSVYFFDNDRDNSILSEFGWNLRPESAIFFNEKLFGGLSKLLDFLWVVESREILWVKRISLEIFDRYDDNDLANGHDPVLKKLQNSPINGRLKRKYKGHELETKHNGRKNFEFCASRDPVLFTYSWDITAC
ncbi:uncharacterized protein LOC114308961 [Camellia sinensis]|uniref:uncharacterized protein LOC114308961 n=1 Tax=Camellia sinensis TaxID=4442 RepID=UPI001035F137|nr:uncharacterized protein LOC114308961 [Camellia sinensis]